MKKLIKSALIVSILSISLFAQLENDTEERYIMTPAIVACDNSYDSCILSCDKLASDDEKAEACGEKCDLTYRNCLDNIVEN